MGLITAMHGNIIYCSDMFCFDMFCWWQHVVDIIISLFHNCSPVLSNPCNTNICPKLPMTWVIHPAPWGLNINRFKFESSASMVGLFNLVYHIIQFTGLIWGSIETRNHFAVHIVDTCFRMQLADAKKIGVSENGDIPKTTSPNIVLGNWEH